MLGCLGSFLKASNAVYNRRRHPFLLHHVQCSNQPVLMHKFPGSKYHLLKKYQKTKQLHLISNAMQQIWTNNSRVPRTFNNLTKRVLPTESSDGPVSHIALIHSILPVLYRVIFLSSGSISLHILSNHTSIYPLDLSSL